MKKIIAASAALMLLGTMASAASAATIDFSGDARARFYYKSDYVPSGLIKKDSEESYWQSRVRLVFKIETKGGAYAMGRFRLGDTFPSGWDGNLGNTVDQRGNYSSTASNFRADWAYVGVPLGSNYVIEAGTGSNTMDRFFRMDTPYNWIRGKYTNGQSGTTVLAFMEKLSEYREQNLADASGKVSVTHGLAYSLTNPNYTGYDDDVNNYGLRLTQKLPQGWLLDAALFYLDDQQGRQNGYGAVARVSGKVANDIGLYGGAAFKSADYQNWLYGGTASRNANGQVLDSKGTAINGDDMNGWGFFVGANVPIGIASIGATAGMTFNGFTASGDFGGDYDGVPFVMIGNGSQNLVSGMLNTGILLGSATGNAWFVNVAPSVKVSDKLRLTAEASYVSVDVRDQLSKTFTGTANLVEVGGIAQYQITDGAQISALLGYLNIDPANSKDTSENPLGFGVSLDLKF